jgi:hypothetical protein
MTDKKSCKSCGIGNCAGCTNFSKWTRNPRLWLSILPEEPGWYWVRRIGEKWCNARYIRYSEIAQLTEPNNEDEFQGPIRPEGE